MKRPLNILIVEDHPGAAAVAAHIMVRAGHEVTVAGNGAVALQLIHNENLRFDALIMEADLPVLGGIEAARLLREHEATANIPIIGLSALKSIPDADVNLEKGCRSTELLEALDTALTANRSRAICPKKPIKV